MSRDGRIELDWADDTYSFRLGLGQWPELQENCDAGPYAILSRLQNGMWRVEDIWNVIRLGLVGGGMDSITALKKIRIHNDEPPLQHLPHAIAILTAGLMGAPEEKVGESEAARGAGRTKNRSRTEKSALPHSTAPAQP